MPSRAKKLPTTKSISTIYDGLSTYYGPVSWEPRYDGISELIFTVLTQHTSDRNAERAFQRLVDYFRITRSLDWMKVLEATV